MTRLVFFLAIAFVLANCTPPKQGMDVDTLDIDLKDFVNTLSKNPKLHEVEIEKTVTIGDESQTKKFLQTDSTFWQKEFSLLLGVDLNAPAILGAFEFQEQINDPGSNLLVDRMTIKPGEESELRYFEFAYLESPEDIRRIAYKKESKSLLFYTKTEQNYFFSPYFDLTQPDSIITKSTQWRYGTDTLFIETSLKRVY